MKTATLFVIGMFLTAVAMADDADDVKAAVQKYFDSLNFRGCGCLGAAFRRGPQHVRWGWRATGGQHFS